MIHIHNDELLSALDTRYYEPEIARYLADAAMVRYRIRVEHALINVLAARGIAPASAPSEVAVAGEKITVVEVQREEERVHHDLRALVNCLRERVSAEVRPYIHLSATSADVVDTARSLAYRDALNNVLIPAFKDLLNILIRIARREAQTVQIGRTHGQHAVPLTFGCAVAGYVSRLGSCIVNLERLTNELPGMCSGAVGAYNASSLIVNDPKNFEREVLAELDLKPVEHSTQVMPTEPFVRLFSEITLATGVFANIADDMRHLQRSEIGEVGEAFASTQVGSSTMPHKKNPISFENVKSLWKIIMPRLTTLFMDQISEHQRDLTGSASTRTHSEIIAYALAAVKRLTRAMSGLALDYERIAENVARSGDLIVAEPLYVILSLLGHPDAHEKVRSLAMRAREERRSIVDMFSEDESLVAYRSRLSEYQLSVLRNPALYTGIAAAEALEIVRQWEEKNNGCCDN